MATYTKEAWERYTYGPSTSHVMGNYEFEVMREMVTDRHHGNDTVVRQYLTSLCTAARLRDQATVMTLLNEVLNT